MRRDERRRVGRVRRSRRVGNGRDRGAAWSKLWRGSMDSGADDDDDELRRQAEHGVDREREESVRERGSSGRKRGEEVRALL
jgi:hypothetical protein